jgi:hypothetical protein
MREESLVEFSCLGEDEWREALLRLGWRFGMEYGLVLG